MSGFHVDMNALAAGTGAACTGCCATTGGGARTPAAWASWRGTCWQAAPAVISSSSSSMAMCDEESSSAVVSMLSVISPADCGR